MPKDSTADVERSIREYTASLGIALGYDAHHEETRLFAFDTEFLRENLPARGTVLDIGCGTGRHVVEFTGPGRTVVGMDLSEHMLDITAGKLERKETLALPLSLKGRGDAGAESSARKAAGKNACPTLQDPPWHTPLVRADMRRPLPFRDGAFDAVVCMFSTIGIIPTAAARAEFVREVRRVLKPGGSFLLHVHNRWHSLLWRDGRRFLWRTYVADRLTTNLEVGDSLMPEYCGIRGMYLHIFTRREIAGLLADNGFAVRTIVPLNESRTAPITGLLKAFRANGFLIAAGVL